MKSITITDADAGMRLDRFLSKTFYSLPRSLMHKEIRRRNIKVNKKRSTPGQILSAGDLLELYLKEDVLKHTKKPMDFLKAGTDLDIIYEDENILLINKKVGVLCHPDGKEYIDNVVARVKRYLYEKGEWDPETSSFAPALANRIDRNTGGIIIAAKNLKALQIINKKINEREIEKYYLAVVHGKMPRKSDTLTAYHQNGEGKNIVSITNKYVEGSKQIITKYTVLDYYKSASLLEVQLLTGRKHQIRAHLAHIGHPLCGDGKYGPRWGRYQQALYSYKLKFSFTDKNELSYLNGKTFQAENIALLEDYKERKF